MQTRLLASLALALTTPLLAAAQVAEPATAAPTAVVAPVASVEASPVVWPAVSVEALPVVAPARAPAPPATIAPTVHVTPVVAASPVAAPRAVVAAPAGAPVAVIALADQAAPQPAQAPNTPPVAVAPPQNRAEQRRVEREQMRAEAAAARRPEAERSKGINIRIDATVIESRGEQVTGRKVLSLTIVDGGGWGQVRSTQSVPFKPQGSAVYSYNRAPLNMDARALLRDDGRIKVDLTLEYQSGGGDHAGTDGAAAEGGPLDQGIRQSVAVVLESGKPLMVAQSADAVGDRRVTLEVKATVLK